jgi:hypothetical protein
MKNTTVIGYRVRTSTDCFVVNDFGGVGTYEPAPVPAPQAYRRVAAYLECARWGDAPIPEVVPISRPLTPMERASRELGTLLSGLCARHGLDLGLSQEQIERKIAQELAELGANPK